jgi:hypothetical protein
LGGNERAQHLEIIKLINMSDINSFGRYTISTLCEKQPDGIHGIAYCPICDKAEKSHDPGKGEKHAIAISIGKVRIHMRLTDKLTVVQSTRLVPD